MPATPDVKKPARPAAPKLPSLVAPYRPFVFAIAGFTIAANALNLLVPKIIARAIDAFAAGGLALRPLVVEVTAVALGIFGFTYLQNVAQVFASERVARDLRTKVIAKLSTQSLAYIERVTSATLLTNLTSDVDAVKLFVSQAVGALISSAFLIVGASALMLSIDWKLGLAVIAVLPIIGVTFQIVLARVRKLFAKAMQAIDRLNKVINESIIGAALIRLLHSGSMSTRFAANTEARDQPRHLACSPA